MQKLYFLVCLLFLLRVNTAVSGQTKLLYKSELPDSAEMVKKMQINIENLTQTIKLTKDHNVAGGLYVERALDEKILQRYDQALTDLSTAIKLSPQFKNAYWNRGVVNEMLRNYQQALSDYQKALSLDINTARQTAILNNNIALVQKKMKNYDAALVADSVAIASDPGYGSSYFNRAETYMLMKKYDLAINDYDRSLKGVANSHFLSNIFSERADAKRFLKKYKDAINDYSAAIKMNPENRLAYWNLAAAYNKNGDYQLANEWYTKAITFYKDDSRNLSRLYDDRALMEMGQEKYKQAIKDDSTAISYDNKYAPAYWNRANAYAQNADFQLSVDAYTQAMNFYQLNNRAMAALFNNMADEEYFLNDFQKVIDYSTSSINLDVQLWGPYLNRGRAYLKKMNKDLAMNDFKKVLELDTTRKSFEYAFALFYTGNPAKAIEVMQNNIVATTNGALLMSHYYNIACLYSLMKLPDQANVYLRKCIEGGYSKKYALADPDLENIRNTQEYNDIMR